MKRNPLLYVFAMLVFALTACIPLPVMQQNEEEAAQFPLGPQMSAQEYQSETFSSFLSLMKDAYIHYDAAGIDWAKIENDGMSQIEAGMNNDQFNEFMRGFEDTLPAGEFTYQSRDEILQLISESNPSTYGGIGAFVDFQPEQIPHVIILDVMPGSPAEEAGLQSHDSIYAIDGVAVGLEEGLGAVSRVRGPVGTKVVLTIETPGKGKRDVTITRGQISGAGILRTEEFADGNVAYVLMPPAADANTVAQIVDELEKYSKNNAFKGLILDLRISNASANWPVDELLTLFQNGPIGTLSNLSQSQNINVAGSDSFGSQTIPLVILVNDHTSGLPEVFSAALQVNDRAVIIGSKTSGQIENLNGFVLPNGAQVFVAGSSFTTSDGENIGLNGVSPKVEVEAGWDEIETGNDPVILAAVEFLNADKAE